MYKEITKSKTVAALGKFDGLHIGHRELVRTAVRKAEELNAFSLMYFIGSAESYLMSHSESYDTAKSMGIDIFIRRTFTDQFKNLDAESFVRDILGKELGCAAVVVGYNFRFARRRSADTNELKKLCDKYGIECIVINEIRHSSISHPVSSSTVRTILAEGRVDLLYPILPGYYGICGKVSKGKRLGRTIGFPTANLELSGPYVLPKDGVYATRCCIDGVFYPSLTNVGTNPTVNGDKISVESHIIDFDGDIYDRDMRVEFVKRIRDEIKFDSLEELKNQIKKDVEVSKSMIAGISDFDK